MSATAPLDAIRDFIAQKAIPLEPAFLQRPIRELLPTLEPLRAEVRRRAFAPAVEACRIVPGILDGNAGVIGAIATFAQQHGLA